MLSVVVCPAVFTRPDVVNRAGGRLWFPRAGVELRFEGSAPTRPGVFLLRGWQTEPGGGSVRFRLVPAPAGAWPDALFVCAKGRVLETPEAGTLWARRRRGWYAGFFPAGSRLELFGEFRVVGPAWRPIGPQAEKPVAAVATGDLTLHPLSGRLEAVRKRSRGGAAGVCAPVVA